MTRTVALLATAVLSATLAPRPLEAGAGADDGPSVRWDKASAVVEVIGLDPARLGALRHLKPDDPSWSSILSLRIARPAGEPASAPMVGRHEVVGEVVRFRPRYPLDPALAYEAAYVPDSAHGRPPIEARIGPEPVDPGPRAEVVAIYPTAVRVPENLLKLYLSFSAPMSRGEAYRRVRLMDTSGKAVERPFLEIGEELWDREMTRITLLFDPGRIKRGLVPREEEGPIMEAGKAYTLEVDAGWPDARGRPLKRAARKAYRAGPPDEASPDLGAWTVEAPAVGSRDPVVNRFAAEPMDRGMVGRAIEALVGVEKASGRVDIKDEETSWWFYPDHPWAAVPIDLRVDSELEDLAGNSIARPFEVDSVRAPSADVGGRYRMIRVTPRR